MEKIKEQLNNPVVTATLGFVLGLIIGLPVLGWWLFPVEWTDGTPEQLREDLKQDYLRMVIESYDADQNDQLAQQRWQELGPDAPQLLSSVINDPSLNPVAVSMFSNLVQASSITPIVPGEVVSTAEPSGGGLFGGINIFYILVVFCLLFLIIGGALVYVLVLKKRPESIEERISPVIETQEFYQVDAKKEKQAAEDVEEQEEPPVAQFMTTYMLGDDLYDDSFSIDSPSGEFLGECGVGISDTIGVGDPKKVTAFEVWLFDKNDIQTVTKVLLSEHGFNDPTISQRLAAKGEPVAIEPGQRILLETATLQLEARVVDMNYGQGALPTNSFFERMTLELAIWPKLGT